MSEQGGMASSKMEAIIEEFADLDKRERLELLLDFAESLPDLPARYQPQQNADEHRVHECQTPVFFWVEVNDGQVEIYAHVAPEAPTVKGFVAILVDAFSGESPKEVLAVQPNLLGRLGLVEALGMVRMRGLNAILIRILQEVRRAGATGSSNGQ